jgi:hypothetical protein
VTRECQEIRELVDSYLSNELLIETNHQVLRHLAACASCSAEVERRRAMRDLLVQSLREDLEVAPLRERIESAIDAERLWWRRTAQWWSAAAVLAAIAVFIWYPRRVDAAAYQDSVGDHVWCALGTRADASYDPVRAEQSLNPPFTQMAAAIGEWHGEYRLVEAHTCPYNGRQYAHFVFFGEGATISLLVEESSRGALPPATMVAPAGDMLPDLLATDHDGYHVDATRTRDHHLFVVSDRAGPEQDRLAKRLLASAVGFIKKLEN